MTKNEQEVYQKALREHGLKVTLIRTYLLHLLTRSKKPLSVHELKKLWKQGTIDIVTLYRALETFTQMSLAKRVDLRHGHADYELVTRTDHHHLICTQCGTTEDIAWCPEKKVEVHILNQSKYFATLQNHALEFFGMCRSCTK